MLDRLDAAVAWAVAGALEGEDVGVVDDAVIIGAATTWSPKTAAQKLKGKLLVKISEACW